MNAPSAVRYRYEVVQGCTFCNTCVHECPVGAIAMTRAGAVIDQARCSHCGACLANCASEAIRRVPLAEAAASSKPQ